MSVGSLKVKIFDAKGTNVVPVAKSTLTVGSSSHCDVVLEHATIQGEHVRAWLEGGRIWIQDLGTTGGTFLNGIRLPGLKPMLVRDLDILKLGDSPSTIGLEANLVRAPIVKAVSNSEEITLTDIKPLTSKDPDLEKRREELAKVSRELAELKLQLQMGKMEKSSTDELRKQINSLRDEVRGLNEQREKLNDGLKRLADEKHTRISATESEIVEMKLKAERDIRDMRDAQGRKLGHWKVDAVAELSRQLHVVTVQKQKSWNTRPLSQDMIFEWESDLNLMFRRVLLEESKHDDHSEHTNTQPLIPRPEAVAAAAAAAAAKSGHSDAAITATRAKPGSAKAADSAKTGVSRTKTKRSKLQDEPNWSRYALIAIGVAFMGVAGWVAKPYFGRSAVRNIASTPETAAVIPAAAASAGASRPASPLFKTNKTYKKTYTENVLYTEGFTDFEMNRELRARWLADLAKAARGEWKVDEKAVMALAGKEQQLVADLQRMKEGAQPQREVDAINQMRARENGFQQELTALLKTPALVEKYQKLKRGFFSKNQALVAKPTR